MSNQDQKLAIAMTLASIFLASSALATPPQDQKSKSEAWEAAADHIENLELEFDCHILISELVVDSTTDANQYIVLVTTEGKECNSALKSLGTRAHVDNIRFHKVKPDEKEITEEVYPAFDDQTLIHEINPEVPPN